MDTQVNYLNSIFKHFNLDDKGSKDENRETIKSQFNTSAGFNLIQNEIEESEVENVDHA